MKTLRLILGDQLNRQHSWFEKIDANTLYLFVEIRQETDYVLHHAQKVLGIFAAMRQFAEELKEQGHQVIYLPIGKTISNHDLIFWIDQILKEYQCEKFAYIEPDEYRLDAQLKVYAQSLTIPSVVVTTEHFLTTRFEVADVFKGQKKWLMETFYRKMRISFNILMNGNKKPIGDKWNFDAENRKPLINQLTFIPNKELWSQCRRPTVNYGSHRGIASLTRSMNCLRA